MKAPKAKRTRGRPVTHGLSRTKAYRSWHWITYCSKKPYFSEAYYGYPISLCKEWRGKKGMTQFYQDMGERPEYAQLKVTDVEQPFSKSNCYWERRPEQLTKEQSNELNQMIQYVSDHRDWLDRWESGFCKRINNYVKRGCPITLQCFIKVKSIFEKLSSRENLSTSNTSNRAPVYPKTDWKGVESFLKMKELESNDAKRPDPSTSRSGQGGTPPPETTSDSPGPQKTSSVELLELEERMRSRSRQAVNLPPTTTTKNATPRPRSGEAEKDWRAAIDELERNKLEKEKEGLSIIKNLLPTERPSTESLSTIDTPEYADGVRVLSIPSWEEVKRGLEECELKQKKAEKASHDDYGSNRSTGTGRSDCVDFSQVVNKDDVPNQDTANLARRSPVDYSPKYFQFLKSRLKEGDIKSSPMTRPGYANDIPPSPNNNDVDEPVLDE